MPGMETAAPERTDTNNGLLLPPNVRPISVSTVFNAFNTSSHVPA